MWLVAMCRILTLWMALILVAAMTGCGDSGTKSCPSPTGENLLANGSFERDGVPTLEGWMPADSSLASIVAQPAPCGGQYSLKLSVDWIPTTAFVTAKVPEARDGDILQLSAYIRAVGPDGGGLIGLVVGSHPWSAGPPAKWVSSAESTWTLVSLVDTISVSEQDTLWVQLSAFGVELAPVSAGLFDLVVLERSDDWLPICRAQPSSRMP